MAILPIDGKRYGTPEMLKIFDEQKKIDYQLQIEGAVGIIFRLACDNCKAPSNSICS